MGNGRLEEVSHLVGSSSAGGASGGVVAGALLLPETWYLSADPRGLTHRVFFRTRFYPWTDIRSITVTGVGTNKRVMVVFAGAGQSLRTRVFSPGLYGTTVEQLLDVLTTYRERHATV